MSYQQRMSDKLKFKMKTPPNEVEIENIHVYIRIRSSDVSEIRHNINNVILCDEKLNLILLKRPENGGVLPLKFDKIFNEKSTQIDIYKNVAYPIVEKAFNGYNATIFAYGQTGSGKTFTMSNISANAELNGIIPRTFSQIFTVISQLSKEKTFVIGVTYLEIYNEQLRDLLASNDSKKLEIHEHVDLGIYVKNLQGFIVDSEESLIEIFKKGNKNRIMKSTKMNNVSSRSHTIFSITVESKNYITNERTLGKLNLVDLAGSERISRAQTSGDSLKETNSINMSLLVLGNVISALVDGRRSHIPYRNSKLTRLLQNSLGGNSKTAMIATISSSALDLEESKCTLRYASRVKQIKNQSYVNVGPSYIEAFEREILELQEKICQLDLQEEIGSAGKHKSSTTFVSKIRKRDEELERTENVKTKLLEKITVIQNKLIFGGEMLLEKVEQQMQLLETSQTEIENLNKTSEELEETLTQLNIDKHDTQGKYSNLQEEDNAITEKLKSVQELLSQAKFTYSYNDHEYQRELEDLYETKKNLTKKFQLEQLIIAKSIPKKYLNEIKSRIEWNVNSQDFQLQGIAFTVNNMRSRKEIPKANLPSLKINLPYYKSVYKFYSKSFK